MPWSGPLLQNAEAVHDIPASYRGINGNLDMQVPGRVIATPALLRHIKDDLALEQVANVATLPGIVGASMAMPDIHHGYGFPIGGVAAFDPDQGGVVSPGGVGFDINCGVRLLATGLTEEQLGDKAAFVDALFEAVPAGMGSRGRDKQSPNAVLDILAEGANWAVEEGLVSANDLRRMEDRGRLEAEPGLVSERALLRGQRSLGSLGSGNHFLEVQVVDDVLRPEDARAFGVDKGQVVIMIHSGSRGLGHQVCQDHVQALQAAPGDVPLVDRQLACAPLGSRAADEYLGAMHAAANFAYANRSVLASLAAGVVESRFGGVCKTVYDVCHNIAKWEEHTVDGQRRNVLVHRKGATRALPPGHGLLPSDLQTSGQPVAVPGDMGRASWLLAGRSGSMDLSFGSSCHGAGRRMARTEARRQFNGRALVEELAARGITVRATSTDIAAEEAPEAYKDVDEVVAAVEMAGLAQRVARLRPVGVVKG